MRIWKLTGATREELDVRGGGFVMQNSDPFGFTFAKSWKTWEVTFPKSAKNNRILEGFWDKNQNQLREFSAVIEILDIPISGTVYISAWDHRGMTGQFVSSFDLFSKQLGNQNLRDLDWSELSHTLNKNVTPNPLFTNKIRYDAGYRGAAWKMGAWQQFGQAFPLSNVDTAELSGAVRVRTILDKIFTGWSVQYSFYGPMDFAELNELWIIPGLRDREYQKDWFTLASRDEEYEKTYFFGTLDVSGNGTLRTRLFGELINEQQGEIPINVASDMTQWVVPEAGAFAMSADFYFDLTLKSLSPVNGVDPKTIFWGDVKLEWIIQRKNPGGSWADWIKRDIFTAATFAAATKTWTWLDIVTLTGNDQKKWGTIDTTIVECAAGTEFRTFARIQFRPFTTGSAPDNSIIQVIVKYHVPFIFWKNEVKVYAHPSLGNGATVPGNYWIPDMTVNDFLKNIQTVFGAESVINWERKIIQFFNRDRAARGTYDLTPKILGGSVSGKFWEPENFHFRWLPHSKNQWARDFYNSSEAEVDLGATGWKTIQPQFAELSLSGRTPNVPWMLNNSSRNPAGLFDRTKWTLDVEPMFAYYEGTQAWNWTQWSADTTTSNSEARTTVPLWSHQKGDISLKWDSPGNGLLAMQHQRNINRLREKKYISCDLVLDTLDIQDFYWLQSGRDLSQNWSVKIPGYDGVYQIVTLEWVGGRVWHAELLEVWTWI